MVGKGKAVEKFNTNNKLVINTNVIVSREASFPSPSSTSKSSESIENGASPTKQQSVTTIIKDEPSIELSDSDEQKGEG
jgi:hypothetical protein